MNFVGYVYIMDMINAQKIEYVENVYYSLIRGSEVIRKELEISGIQDGRLKYEQNWISQLERLDNTRLPKHALNYKPRARRDRGRSWKRRQCVDAGTGQTI